MVWLKKGTYREENENRNARCPDDWTLHAHMEGLPRGSAGAPSQAHHRRTQDPPIQTQSSVQPGDAVDKATGREDRLRTFAKAWGFAPCAARFAEHGLAQCLISRVCRLYADLRIQNRVTAIDEIGRTEAERDYVRGSGSMALPPLPYRRRAYRARDSG